MNPFLAFATLACLLFYFSTGIVVARSRLAHGLAAPAMHGHPIVERALRVQGNSLEWLVIFLPSLWLFCAFYDPRIGAAAAAVWVSGRVLYMLGYLRDVAARGPGFLIQALATAVMLFGALAGAVTQVVQQGWG